MSTTAAPDEMTGCAVSPNDVSRGCDGLCHPAICRTYTLGEKIGRGCFATVYKAFRRSDGSQVAVKVVNKARLDAETALLLQNELEVLRAVSEHPGIVTLLDHIETGTHMYFVMEYIGGGQLLDRIVARGSFSENDARIILRTALLTLDFLANLGCVHRDIKPENILVDNHSKIWPVKLTDFGLSTKMQPDELLYGTLGTPLFVAPEILSGKGYDSSCDMWSLGVVLYLVLCGYPPFPYGNPNRLIAAIFNADYSFPAREWDHVSRDAKDAVRRMMEVDPKRRITPREALTHPWFKAAQSTSDLPNAELKTFNARRKMKATMLAVRTTFGLMRIVSPTRSVGGVATTPQELLEDVEKSRALIEALGINGRASQRLEDETEADVEQLRLRSRRSLLLPVSTSGLEDDKNETSNVRRISSSSKHQGLPSRDSLQWNSQVMQSRAKAMVAEMKDIAAVEDNANPFFSESPKQGDRRNSERPRNLKQLDFREL